MTVPKNDRAVGLIGLGNMGSALADALIADRFDVTVWNRTPARVERFARAGIRVASSLADVAHSSKILVVCLLDHSATMSTINSPLFAPAMRGRTFIQLTTMTSAESRDMSQWAHVNGINYLEGQILNYPDDIRSGRGIIVCAGPIGVFQSCRSVIEAMAEFAPHISETLGAAAILDKALFEIAYPSFVGFLHGAVMCRAAGVSVEDYTAIALAAYFKGKLIEKEIGNLARRILTRNYDENVEAALDAYCLGFAKTLRESEALGIETEHLTGVDNVLRRACAAGHNGHDFAAVYELFGPKKE